MSLDVLATLLRQRPSVLSRVAVPSVFTFCTQNVPSEQVQATFLAAKSLQDLPGDLHWSSSQEIVEQIRGINSRVHNVNRQSVLPYHLRSVPLQHRTREMLSGKLEFFHVPDTQVNIQPGSHELLFSVNRYQVVSLLSFLDKILRSAFHREETRSSRAEATVKALERGIYKSLMFRSGCGLSAAG